MEAKGTCINGLVYVPTARVKLDCERYAGKVEVMVVDDLDHNVLLGTDPDTWDDLNTGKGNRGDDSDPIRPNIPVLTRAQKQQQIDKEIIAHQKLCQ